MKREWTEAHCGSVRTLERAKQELGVECFRETPTGPWYWKRPDCQDRQVIGEFGNVGTETPPYPTSTHYSGNPKVVDVDDVNRLLMEAAVLSRLARLGYGTLEDMIPSQKGGRPKRVFRLMDTVDTDTKPHKSRVLEGFVSISNVSSMKAQNESGTIQNSYHPKVVDVESVNRLLLEATVAISFD